jgi:3-ketosteroid 9alpha-monooxygenase subunit A
VNVDAAIDEARRTATASPRQSTRRIDLPLYPIGWFAIAASADLNAGDVVSKTFCGQDVVLFRDHGGNAAVLDAYCPHLGANLGVGGTVEDDGLRCPFHGWKWSPEGKCVDMPYGGRISPGARTRYWPVEEQDGVILVWSGSEPPPWHMPTFDDEEWTEPRITVRTIRSHPQEILENSVDFAHFRFVHQTHMMKLVGEPSIAGPIFDMRISADPKAVDESMRLPTDFLLDGLSVCHGPGLTFAKLQMQGTSAGLHRLYATPIDGERIQLLGMVTLQTNAAGGEDPTPYLDLLSEQVFENWYRDIEVWENKRYQPKPILNRTETLIPEFRRWYSQFYTADETQP